MHSYTLLPNDVKNVEQLVVSKLITIHDWTNYNTLLSILKHFDGHTSFSVWQHKRVKQTSEIVQENQSPSLLAGCTYIGNLTSAMDILRFFPNALCSAALQEQLRKSGLKVIAAQDMSSDLLAEFQSRLISAVTKNIFETCSSLPMIEINEQKTHCILKFDKSITAQSSYLLFDDGSQRTVWQHLRELRFSPNLSFANIYYLERQPNGMGVILHCLKLTYTQKFKQEISQLLQPHSDSTVTTQNQQYLECMMTDLFASTGNESSHQCPSNIAHLCEIDFETIQFDYSPNFIKISLNIVWQFVVETAYKQIYANNFNKEVIRSWGERIAKIETDIAYRKRDRQYEAAAKAVNVVMREAPVHIMQEAPEPTQQQQGMEGNNDSDEELARALQLSLENDHKKKKPATVKHERERINTDDDEALELALAVEASMQNTVELPDDNLELQQAILQSSTTPPVKELCRSLLTEFEKGAWDNEMVKYLKRILLSDAVLAEAKVLATLQEYAAAESQKKISRFKVFSKKNDASQSFYAMVIAADTLSTLLAMIKTTPPASFKHIVGKK